MLMAYLQKYVFKIKTKIINVKVINMLKINEAKILIKHISCDLKYKCNSTACISIKYAITKNINVTVKIIISAKKIIVRI